MSQEIRPEGRPTSLHIWKNYLYNLAAALILLAVTGHFVDQCVDKSWVSKSLYLFIYSFHMPLLFFLAGTFYRDLEKDKAKARQAALCSLCLYILMKAVISLVRMPFKGAFSFSLLSESGAPWIFFAVAVYFGLAFVLTKVNKKVLLAASIFLALLCGYSDKIGDFLMLSRLIVFFPFFICGWMAGIERTERWTGKMSLRVLGAVALLLALLVSVGLCQKVYFMRPLFTGRNAYTSLGNKASLGPVFRLLAYGVSAVLAAAVLAVTPRRSLGKLVDALGGQALAIYFWHRPILYLLTSLWGYAAFERVFGWKMGRIVWVLCGLVCVAVLSIKSFGWPFRALYRALESPKEWFVCLRGRGTNVSSDDSRVFVVNSKRKCVAFYTVLFLAGCLVCFWPYIGAGKSLIWSYDGLNLHYPALMTYGRYLRQVFIGLFHGELNFSQFDFSIGYGLERLSFVLPNYAEPINLFSVFVPENYTEYLYDALVIVRLYLVGLSFLAYCFYTKKDHYSTCVAALVYTFCNFTLAAGPRHPYFLGAMICLPLLLIGVEDILERPSISSKLCAAVMLSAISSYYFLWMNAIFCVVYYLLHFCERTEKTWRLFIKEVTAAILSALLGIAISAVFLLPNVLLYLASVRTRGVLSPKVWPSYNSNYLKRVIGYIATPWLGPGNWSHLGIMGMGVVCVFAFFTRIKRHRALKAGYLIALFALMIPACALFMDAFTTVRNRWSYQIVLLMAVIVAVTWSKIASFSKKDFLIVFACVAAYTVYIGLTPVAQNEYSFVGIILLLLSFICVYIAAEIGFASQKSQLLIFSMILVCVWVTGNMVYSPRYGNYMNEFWTKEEVSASAETESAYGALKTVEDAGFYRTDTNSLARKYVGTPIVLGVNGTSIFNNVLDGNIYRYMDTVSNEGTSSSVVLNGLDNRTFLMTSNQVKYWVSKEDGTSVPFGFEKLHPDKDWIIYKNNYYLPLGYTYTNTITEDALLKLSPVERQEALMQAVSLEKADETSAGVDAGRHDIEYSILSCDGIKKQDDGTYSVTKKNAVLTIQFERWENAEHYVYFKGMDVSQNGDVEWTLKIQSKQTGKTAQCFFRSRYAVFKTISDPLVNLGYTQEGGEATYTITFPSKGTFKLDSLEVCAQSMENYPAYVDKLSEDTLEDLEIGLNTVSGTLSLDREKYLYFSIPYSTGWKATVDGEKTDILRANIAFMAIPVGPGEHEIVLTYHTPGLAIGAGISAASLALLLVLLRREKRRKSTGTGVPGRI